MSTLVYAYGCGEPIHGSNYAFREVVRCRAMWDELVALDQAKSKEELVQARADDPCLDQLSSKLDTQTTYLIEHPDDKDVRAQRRVAFRARRGILNAWRKTHREFLQVLNSQRMAQVTHIRQRYTNESIDPLYWGNSNRLLQSYETGRRVAALKGRLIHPSDPERDDGVLTVQIQRTRSGLGAAPHELHDGTFAHLQIGEPDARGQARFTMRVDAAGHHIELPVWIHRPLPAKARVKAAQLVYRPRGPRLRWQLCLSLDVSDCDLYAPMRSAANGMRVEFDWLEQGYLEVMRIEGQIWRLPQGWMARLDGLEGRQGELDTALGLARGRWTEGRMSGLLALPTWKERIEQIALARGQLEEEQIRWWVGARRLWLSLPGERAHILLARRELYRHWARDVVSRYAALCLPEQDLATYARENRGEEDNRWRHRAAVHTLRAEITHQASKAGTPILDASGRMMNAPKERKSSSWARRKAGTAKRSQRPPQDSDPAGIDS